MIKRTFRHLFGKSMQSAAKQMRNVRPSGPVAEPVAELDSFFRLLTECGFSARHIVDVGANHGNWTRNALQYFPDAHFTLLEPQHWLQASIKDLMDNNDNIRFHAVGAGSHSGTETFTIVDRDDSSSFRFSKEIAAQHGFTQVEIAIVTLNELLQDSNSGVPDIIKIDAEGLDLEVLKGATNYLGTTELLLVEAGVGSRDIANSILEVMNFMDSRGYTLFDITDLNRPFKPPVLWLTELAFIKKGGFLYNHQVM